MESNLVVFEQDQKICTHLVEQLKDEIKLLNNMAEFDEKCEVLKIIQDHGKSIYQYNSNMRDIGEFMEHPESRAFFEKHMKTWGDLTVTVMNLKLYDIIDKYIKKFKLLDENTNGYHRLYIISKLMNDKKIRHTICKEMSIWINDTKYLRTISSDIEGEYEIDNTDKVKYLTLEKN
jgi:hypothetical protein